jgi:hypothetical protein
MKWNVAKKRDWVAITISMLALLFTALQWINARSATSFATRPLIDFYTEDDVDEPRVGLEILNDGPGAAIIKSVTYYIDDKSVGDYQRADESYDKRIGLKSADDDYVLFLDYDPGDALAPGQSSWMFFRRSSQRKDLDKFIDFVDNHLAIGVTYCSVRNECWQKCSTANRCSGH